MDTAKKEWSKVLCGAHFMILIVLAIIALIMLETPENAKVFESSLVAILYILYMIWNIVVGCVFGWIGEID